MNNAGREEILAGKSFFMKNIIIKYVYFLEFRLFLSSITRVRWSPDFFQLIGHAFEVNLQVNESLVFSR
ncbi:hypothetical protein F4694_005397 [Bacillus niacini]|uniref:Uncharacterized protein n=1 Tax=Neobacillus niacini TaxID=86668 RepID=A0A852TJU1_9BACI|nr:hypothetical protein [Neobacillus niacini]